MPNNFQTRIPLTSTSIKILSNKLGSGIDVEDGDKEMIDLFFRGPQLDETTV